MDDDELLARQFEAHRPHLRAVAYRMLGSAAEADDALQEAWIKTSRAAATTDIHNMGGWLTTVVSRVCLTMLDTRKRRREDALDDGHLLPDPVVAVIDTKGPEQEALAADAVGVALLVVLEQLQPAERLAFVLHDLFAVSFEDIARIVDRSPAAARQLASRARRRVQGADPEAEAAADRAVVDAFLAASRGGDFEALLAVLDPDIVLRADEGGTALRIVEGARAVATSAIYAAAARDARPALVDGSAGFVGYQDGVPVAILAFSIADGRVVGIDAIGDPARVAALVGEGA